MSAVEAEVIRWGAEGARILPWRGDAAVAYLSPLADRSVPSADFVLHCMQRLADQGFRKVVTSALAPLEQAGFLAAGFRVEQDLEVLSHQLRGLPRPSPAALVPRRSLRPAGPDDHQAVLAVDHRAFSPFWHLDLVALTEVLRATPRSRFQVVVGEPGGVVLGYAITGRTRDRGFLQRVAVDPSHFRQGIGRALVVDGLRWLRRWHVGRAVVNTQPGNHGALALYEGLGFRRQPFRLSVLSAGIGP